MTNKTMARRFVMAGAILFVVGLFTGLWAGAVLTGTVKIGIPRLALSAHLNGLLGGLWLMASGFSLSFLSYNESQCRRLFFLIAIPCWFNWGVTLVASFLGVSGLVYNANASNNAIAFLLQVFVVLPSLIGGLYWLWGFRKAK